MPRVAVNLSADFRDRGGWGRHARGFGTSLAKYADVALCGSNSHKAWNDQVDGDVGLTLSTTPIENAIGIGLGPASSLTQAIGAPRILYTVWETSKVPTHFAQEINRADQVWVPTDWGREIFANAGISEDKLKVVPEGVNSDLFRPPQQQAARATFRFVCVGKWEERKATAYLVRAFAAEFSEADDVELVMHCHNIYMPFFDQKQAIAKEVFTVTDKPPQILVSNHGSLDQLIALLQTSDAFVLPTRAEAWGLPILEAMACGLPCITTNYGGHLAFANQANGYLIDTKTFCQVNDPMNFSPEVDWGVWAEPDIRHLRDLMRHVFENQDEAAEKGIRARGDAVKLWSWDNAASKAHSHLSNL